VGSHQWIQKNNVRLPAKAEKRLTAEVARLLVVGKRVDKHYEHLIFTPMAESDRGFASMDPEKQRQIASKGGKAAHEKGTAHEWDSEEAREAGRKGGETVSQDREHMSEIGRKGGQA